MRQDHLGRLWLPWLVAVIGILLSCVLWYIIRHDITPHQTSNLAIETYHPWFVLILGTLLSMLVAFTIRIAQIARQRAQTLKLINEDLKKEIGERIHAEETRQKLENALLQGQKLQAIGTLAGGIAHDFNNLLYAIIGYIELAREDVIKDSLVYKNLGKVLDAARRGQELVARILAFSRRQHHEFESLNLISTIEAVLSLLRPTIPASVNILFEPTAEPVPILGNQTQLHQVLVNLINNAVDAMDGEGSITILVTKVNKDEPVLREFPTIAPKNYYKIMLSDTGHGMDKQTMERIFEPFFTTKEVGKGTGLGLSIVHSIIKEHQGEITVSSQLGQGTTFMLLLPEYASN